MTIPTQPSDLEALANRLYVAVVQPDTIWWDDLTPDLKEGWLRAARAMEGWPIGINRIAAAMADPLVGPLVIDLLQKQGYQFAVQPSDDPT